MSNIDVTTIEAILLAKFLADKTQTDRASASLYETLGMPRPEVTPADEAFKVDMYKVMAAVIAIRLVANDRSVTLLTGDDLEEVIHVFCLSKAAQDGLDEEATLMAETVIKTSLKGYFDYALSMVDDRNPYDEYWRMITVIETLANDEMLAPDAVLTAEMYDEVTRRLYTREQYLAQAEKALKIVADPEALLNSMITPALDLLCSDDPELRAEIEDEIREMMTAQLMPLFTKMESAMRVMMTEEADRIYAE